MIIVEQINQDLKKAMLGGDKQAVSTLRGVKSAIQYAAVAKRSGSELDESEVLAVLQKEAKKRTEAAVLYEKSGSSERAEQELSEKKIIDIYLPTQMSEAELNDLIEATADEVGGIDRQNMGQIIGKVKAKVGTRADGAEVARLVQSRIQK